MSAYPLIVAVDFDSTIAVTEKDLIPRTLLPNAKVVLDFLYDKCYIIIWTCRYGKTLEVAKKFLEAQGIKYHAINENYDKLDFQTSRKIYYDILIDDKNLCPVDWLDIKKQVSKRLISRLAKDLIELSKVIFNA